MTQQARQQEISQSANRSGGMKSIADFCADNGVSRSYAYVANAAGKLRFTKVGRATRIKYEDEQAWRDSLPVIEGAAASMLAAQ